MITRKKCRLAVRLRERVGSTRGSPDSVRFPPGAFQDATHSRALTERRGVLHARVHPRHGLARDEELRDRAFRLGGGFAIERVPLRGGDAYSSSPIVWKAG